MMMIDENEDEMVDEEGLPEVDEDDEDDIDEEDGDLDMFGGEETDDGRRDRDWM